MPIIGDAGFVAKLQEILQIRGGVGIPHEVEEPIQLVVAIDAGALLSRAPRIALSDLSTELITSDTELTLAGIAQGATATQLNQDLGAGVNAAETIEILGLDVWARLMTFNAGDRAEVDVIVETLLRGAFPPLGRRVGGIRHQRLTIDLDQGRTSSIVTLIFPAPLRIRKISTTVANILGQWQVTNRRAAPGAIDVAIGGAIYFRPLT